MEQLTPDDRVAAQEKALDATNCEIALLRQHMDSRFASMRESSDAQFTSMRESTDAQFASMRESTDAQFASMRESTDAQFASMRESTDAQFANMRESTDARLAGIRQYVDDGFVKLRLEMQLHTNQALASAVEHLSAKIDKSTHWSIGLIISGLIGIIALAARGLL